MTTTTNEKRNAARRQKRLIERVEKRGPHWQAVVQYMSPNEREDGRKLLLSVAFVEDDQQYLVGAVETGNVDTPQDIFDDHGHQHIGYFDLEVEAKQASKDYLLAWLRGDESSMLEACACENIESAGDAPGLQ